MGDTADKIAPVVIGLLFLVAGTYLYVSGQQATANAEEVEAEIVTSEVVNYKPSDEMGPNSDDYRASIEFRFTYDGETYTSSKICPGDGHSCAPSGTDRSEAEKFVADHPEGETVTAYVPKGDPAAAYLVESSNPLMYLGLAGFGLVAIVLGLRKAVL